GRETPARMAGQALEDERRTVHVGRLPHVRRHLELGTHVLRHVHELPGLVESVQIIAEVRHHLASDRTSCSARTGHSVSSMPSASATAFVIAAGPGTADPSPVPLTCRGLSGDGESTPVTSMRGTLSARGSPYSMSVPVRGCPASSYTIASDSAAPMPCT